MVNPLPETNEYGTVRVKEERDAVEFSVTDHGIPIDMEDESHIWEFGWRGSKAKELHVNGGGIGLYTVKKIVRGHGGTVGFRKSGQAKDVITFFFRIPQKDILKKVALL